MSERVTKDQAPFPARRPLDPRAVECPRINFGRVVHLSSRGQLCPECSICNGSGWVYLCDKCGKAHPKRKSGGSGAAVVWCPGSGCLPLPDDAAWVNIAQKHVEPVELPLFVAFMGQHSFARTTPEAAYYAAAAAGIGVEIVHVSPGIEVAVRLDHGPNGERREIATRESHHDALCAAYDAVRPL